MLGGMAETVLDTFVSKFVFQTDRAGLRSVQTGIGRLQKALPGLSPAAAGALAGVGVGTALLGARLAKGAAEIERGWSVIAARTGESRDEILENFGDLSLELSREFGLSQVTIQDAIEKIISGGVRDIDRARELLREALTFEKAGLGDAPVAISAATTLLGLFSAEGAKAAGVVSLDHGGGATGRGRFQRVCERSKDSRRGRQAHWGCRLPAIASLLADVASKAPSVSEASTAVRGLPSDAQQAEQGSRAHILQSVRRPGTLD